MMDRVFSCGRRGAVVFTFATALVVLGCEGQGAWPTSPVAQPPSTNPAVGNDPAGALEGELVAYMADYADHAERYHALRLPSGEEHRLAFAEAPNLPPLGAKIRVWGDSMAADGIQVSRFEMVAAPEIEANARALVDGPKKPVRKWAFVLVDLNGRGVNLTKENAERALFDETNPESIRSYYREASFGTQDLDGDVLGPFRYDERRACDSNGVVQALGPRIEGDYDQYLFYFGNRAQCGWLGLAQLGSVQRPGQVSWYNASYDCVVLVQEPGHNFGMVHSSAISCSKGGTPVPLVDDFAPDDVECGHSEYGNPFDPMGRGCFHMNGYQKAYQGWVSGCNVVKAKTSGLYTIFPLETPCNGAQVLQVPLVEPRNFRLGQSGNPVTNYYVELRTPVGFDSRLSPRVLVSLGDDTREARRSGGRNWLVDMNPDSRGDMRDAALPVGRTYSDPTTGGPKITVVSATAEKAVIRVELSTGGGDPNTPGQGTCENGTAFQAPGPATCATPINAPPATPEPDAGAPDAGAPPEDAAPTTPMGNDAAPPNPDDTKTGSGGSGGSSGAGGSSGEGSSRRGGQTGSGNAGSPGSSEEPVMVSAKGCGCRTAGEGGGPGASPLLLILAGLLVARRRRRRR